MLIAKVFPDTHRLQKRLDRERFGRLCNRVANNILRKQSQLSLSFAFFRMSTYLPFPHVPANDNFSPALDKIPPCHLPHTAPSRYSCKTTLQPFRTGMNNSTYKSFCFIKQGPCIPSDYRYRTYPIPISCNFSFSFITHFLFLLSVF